MAPSSFESRRGGDGFTAEVTGAEARRQFRMSVGLVAMLAIGILSAAATIGTHPVAAKRHVAATAPAAAQHAEAAPAGANAI